MAEFDRGTKKVAEKAGKQLARLAKVNTRGGWRPAESTVQATVERLADRVFIAGKGEGRIVVYFEFVTYRANQVPLNVLAKSGLLSHREGLATRSIVVVLSRQGYPQHLEDERMKQPRTLSLGPKEDWTQQVRFHEVCLWRFKPEEWWEKEPGLMALYPLCQHGLEAKESIVHAASVIERVVNDPIERADLLTLLGIFGGLAFPHLGAKDIIGRHKMKESPFYQEILAEGREEGALQNARANVLSILKKRFGDKAMEQVQPNVEAVNDLKKLERLVLHAATCADFTAFLKKAPASPTKV